MLSFLLFLLCFITLLLPPLHTPSIAQAPKPSVPPSCLLPSPCPGATATVCSAAQFRGRLPVLCLHAGAHPLLGCGPPPPPGAPAEPPAAPHPPAPAGPQRPPCHLPEPGPAPHGAWRRGTPRGAAGGPGEPGRSFPVQRCRGGPIQVQPRQLGPCDGADPQQRSGCQVLPVSPPLPFCFTVRMTNIYH